MPRVHEESVDVNDERAELVLEPDQAVDLLRHWAAVPLHTTDHKSYQYAGDGALCITRIATTSPDVFVTFAGDHDWRKHVVGGPWLLGVGVDLKWIVPVRRTFTLTAYNRSRETIRATIYMQVAAHQRRGW